MQRPQNIKLRLLTYAILGLLAFFPGCKSDDPQPACQLLSYEDTFRHGLVIYSFNNAGNITGDLVVLAGDDGTDSISRKYVFNSDGRVKERTGLRNYHEEWKYNSEGLLSEITTTRGRRFDSTIIIDVSQKNYYYTGDKLTSYRIETDEGVETGAFRYDGENVTFDSIHYVQTGGQAATWIATYSKYDSKKNPKQLLTSAFGKQQFVPSDFPPEARDLSENNVVEADEAGQKISSTYEYNQAGLPLREVRNYLTGGTYLVDFSYDHCK